MPIVVMNSRTTCTLCGCRLRGILVATVRVRKHDLVADRGTLSSIDFRCPECGFETASAPNRWRLDDESQAKVDAARAKRGWAP